MMNEKLECLRLAIEYVKHKDANRADRKFTTEIGVINLAKTFHEYIKSNEDLN